MRRLPTVFGVFTTFSDDIPDVKRFAQVNWLKSLTLEGKCLCRRAKPAHIGGHLPGMYNTGYGENIDIMSFRGGETMVATPPLVNPLLHPLPLDRYNGQELRVDEGIRGMSMEEAQQILADYPGITPDLFKLEASGRQVNWFWKWLSQFYEGESKTEPKIITEPVDTKTSGGQEGMAAALQAAADAYRSELDPIAAKQSTIGVFRGVTPEGELVDVVGSGKRDLGPSLRDYVALSGDLPSKLYGADAEMTALEYMLNNNIEPIAGGISRDVCGVCRYIIESQEVGGSFITPRQVIFR